MKTEAKIETVKDYWKGENIPQQWYSQKVPFSLQWFNDLAKKRYKTYYSYLLQDAEFEWHSGEKVLEVGVGIGTDLVQYAKHGAKVYGVDLGQDQVDYTKRNFDVNNLKYEDIKQGSAENLPFDSEQFNLVYSFGVLHHTPDTEGAIDESIRHSITKMSHLHFAATEKYRSRIIQLGENPNRVFNVGGLGIDNINKLKLLSKDDFENSVGLKLADKNILVTFHPVTLEKSTSEYQFQELLDSICNLKNTKIIFTKANSDTGGRIINTMIDNYVAQQGNSIAYKSMGQLHYLSALQFMDAVIGNSSSGLIEAPSFKIGTIDIGDRQKGRIQAKSVIHCFPKKESIDGALVKLYSSDFQEIINNVINPYGDGGASKKIASIIKEKKLDNIIKKSFFDI